MGRLGDALKAHWTARGLMFRPGALEETLAEFECRHTIRLPSDMRDYFSIVDGMDAVDEENLFGWDEDLFRFWPLSEVECVTDYFSLHRPSAFYIFSDHSINLPSFAIRLTPKTSSGNCVLAIYSDCGTFKATKVAGSFSEFLGKYLEGEVSRYGLL